MITRENIIKRLTQKYPQYSFIPTEVTKNGYVRLKDICVIDNSPIAPTIYTDDIIKRCQDNLEEAVEIISNIIKQHQAPDSDLSKLQDKDFILSRIRIGVQKESKEELVKCSVPEYPGMEAYLYFAEHSDNHDMWSIKIKNDLLATAGIDEDKAWCIAEKHTFEATMLQSMTEVLAEMLDADFSPCLAELTPCEMYVISNRDKCKGVAGILNHDLLRNFASKHNCKSLCVLDSSIHEAILVPLHAEYSINEFTAMVREVNSTQVAPEDVLVDRAYVIEFD